MFFEYFHSLLSFCAHFLPFKNGVPSDDTLRRFFPAVDHTEFQRLFIEWIRAWLSPEVANKVIAIESERHSEASVSNETRYFIGSKTIISAQETLTAIRQHNAPTNVAIIRHAALNMIRQAKPKRVSVRMMRKSAGWDNSVLTNVLSQVF